MTLLVVLAASIVLVDLVSKLLAVAHLSGRAPVELVPNVLDIRLTRNSGAAFSMAGGATVVLSLVAFVVVVVIVRVARRLRSQWWAVVLGLLAGGAVGNLIDRVFRDPSPLRGHVVDWIHLSHWPVFNVADAAISVGAVLAVLLSLWGVALDGTRIGQAAPAASPATGVEAPGSVSASVSEPEPEYPSKSAEVDARADSASDGASDGDGDGGRPPGGESGAGR